MCNILLETRELWISTLLNDLPKDHKKERLVKKAILFDVFQFPWRRWRRWQEMKSTNSKDGITAEETRILVLVSMIFSNLPKPYGHHRSYRWCSKKRSRTNLQVGFWMLKRPKFSSSLWSERRLMSVTLTGVIKLPHF